MNDILMDIKSALSQSALPEKLRDDLLNALQRLGKRQTKQLADLCMVSGYDSELEMCAGVAVSSAGAISDVRAGSVQSLVKFLAAAIKDPNTHFGKLVTPFVLDLMHDELPKLQPDVAQEVRDVVRKFELGLFKYLPDEELLRLVNVDILFAIVGREDILADFRWVYYVAEPIYDQGLWGRQFLPGLKKNQELLGSQIILGSQQLAPTVENWLLEYDAFAGKPGPQRQALDRLHFVQDNPNAKALGKPEQDMLLKLCELYDWFSDPFVTEAEVSEFEDISSGEQRAGLVHAQLQGSVGQAAPVKVAERSAPAGNVGAVQNNKAPEARVVLGVARVDGDVNAQSKIMDTPEPVAAGLSVNREPEAVGAPQFVPAKQAPAVPPPVATPVSVAPKVQSKSAQVRPTGGFKPKQSSAPRLPGPEEEALLRAPTLEDVRIEAEQKKLQMQADIDAKLAKMRKT